MHWKTREEKNKQFLDHIDFMKYITVGADIEDIMDRVQDDYGEMAQYDSALEGCVFNCFDTYDFSNYLSNRYPNVHIAEEEIINYRIWRVDEDATDN